MNIQTYTVKPRLPAPLKPLEEIAHNLWLSWNFDAVELFIRLDYDAWLKSSQSPVRALGLASPKNLAKAAKDTSYLAALNEVYADFKKYKKMPAWYKGSRKDVIAYFSMEYGLDVSLPVYSGGLGMLSGDHMKTSSDMGLPLVGIGLLYRQGYFKQLLNADGFQQELYPENDWYNMPVELMMKKKAGKGQAAEPIVINVELAGRPCYAQIWEVKVGRNSLFLLDTNIDKNPQDFRNITAALYGGDSENRIRQEILLGIGGIRALRAMGINPAVTHMNEGHAAFLSLERIRELMQDKGFSFAEAREAVWPTNIFTTHTPVPAGNERFDIYLIEKYLKSWCDVLKISWTELLALGREHPYDDRERFCMTVLALKLSAYANGVARLHGQVSRKMWQGLWPGLPVEEVPIHHVTNGVHPRSWISDNMKQLLDRYLGPHFKDQPTDLSMWDNIDRISDEELWRCHERRRERLVVFARERRVAELKRNGADERQLQAAQDALSPYVLTLSFARRFATYKRGTLLLRDPERLMKILTDKDRPVQLIFAGKAHPQDLPGKELIREIIHFAKEHNVENRIVFLENYDMGVSKYMVSGSDVWLNTPRRPQEASGTSGMKAAMNGVLNCSIMDGWWDEAYTSDIGWAIGHGEEYSDTNLQDEIESKALYDILENEVIPLFYTRGRDGLPREWIKRMKSSMKKIGPSMSTHRMVMDYANNFYLPALKNYREMSGDNYARAKSLAAYFGKVEGAWDQLKFIKVESNAKPVMQRGDKLQVNAYIEMGSLKPEDLLVELYYGPVSSETHDIAEASRVEMKCTGQEGSAYRYRITVECRSTGIEGHTVRILPKHPGLVHPYRSGLIKWA
jgi:starch phosphorylase